MEITKIKNLSHKKFVREFTNIKFNWYDFVRVSDASYYNSGDFLKIQVSNIFNPIITIYTIDVDTHKKLKKYRIKVNNNVTITLEWDV